MNLVLQMLFSQMLTNLFNLSFLDHLQSCRIFSMTGAAHLNESFYNTGPRLEREKQELRDYMEKDKKAMREKMSEEEADRRQKEEELKRKLREQQQQSENEIINLYKVGPVGQNLTDLNNTTLFCKLDCFFVFVTMPCIRNYSTSSGTSFV